MAVKADSDLLLFDCGEGSQRQMIRYGTGFSVDAVFFTHFHADHYLGIIGFLRTLGMMGREEKLVLHGPAPAKRLLNQAVHLGVDQLGVPAGDHRAEGRRPHPAARLLGARGRGAAPHQRPRLRARGRRPRRPLPPRARPGAGRAGGPGLRPAAAGRVGGRARREDGDAGGRDGAHAARAEAGALGRHPPLRGDGRGRAPGGHPHPRVDLLRRRPGPGAGDAGTRRRGRRGASRTRRARTGSSSPTSARGTTPTSGGS